MTHQLETTRRGTSEDAERRQPREGHPQTGNRRGRYKSRRGKKLTGGGLTNWKQQREGQVRSQKKATENVAPTCWRKKGEGQVNRRKLSDRAMGAHRLDTAEGGTIQDTEESDRMRALTL